MTEEAKDWIFAQVVDSGHFNFPRPVFWLGWVEFTSLQWIQPSERSSLEASLRDFGLPEIQASDRRRVARTIVLGETRADAKIEGELRLREALGVLGSRVAPVMGNFDLLKAGCLTDILDGTTHPLLSPRQGLKFGAWIMDERAQQPMWVLNLLLAAPLGFGELGSAYLRSFEWSRLAAQARTKSERLLLYWMAAESICTVTQGGTPIPNLMAVCGFPTGKRAVSAPLLRQAIANHASWSSRLTGLLERVRIARNSIVHDGYRDADIRHALSPTDEQEALRFLPLAVRCLHTYAEERLTEGAAPLAETWNDRGPRTDEMTNCAKWIVDHLEGRNDAFREV